MSTSATSPIRYAIYTRQSSDSLQDFSSCQVQFMTCEDFARQTGEANLHWIGERFDDEGYSGVTLDRPAMRKLRKVIELGGLDRVYVAAIDRLTRNMRDAVVLLDELDRAGVELRLVHQPELTSGPEYRFLKHVLAAFAQFEREMIASRIAESRAYLKKHGRRIAGKVPYGYDSDAATKQLVPNAAEARRVRAVFGRAADGQLPKQIAFACNKQGWSTKVYHAKRSGKVTGGGRWTTRQILTVLRNPVYIGVSPMATSRGRVVTSPSSTLNSSNGCNSSYLHDGRRSGRRGLRTATPSDKRSSAPDVAGFSQPTRARKRPPSRAAWSLSLAGLQGAVV